MGSSWLGRLCEKVLSLTFDIHVHELFDQCALVAINSPIA
jgi:hypothetical protein